MHLSFNPQNTANRSYYPLILEDETEAQRSPETCPGPHSLQMAQLGFESNTNYNTCGLFTPFPTSVNNLKHKDHDLHSFERSQVSGILKYIHIY